MRRLNRRRADPRVHFHILLDRRLIIDHHWATQNVRRGNSVADRRNIATNYLKLQMISRCRADHADRTHRRPSWYNVAKKATPTKCGMYRRVLLRPNRRNQLSSWFIEIFNAHERLKRTAVGVTSQARLPKQQIYHIFMAVAASQQFGALDFRFGSKADIHPASADVAESLSLRSRCWAEIRESI